MIQCFRSGLLVVLIVVFASCARPAPQMSGIIIYGHEVHTVRLCGDSQIFWLHATQEQQRQLAGQTRRLTRYPYQELYLVFTGNMSADAPGEFARDYAGTVKVESIVDLSAQIPDSCSRLRQVP